jgi:hypothetical protein
VEEIQAREEAEGELSEGIVVGKTVKLVVLDKSANIVWQKSSGLSAKVVLTNSPL